MSHPYTQVKYCIIESNWNRSIRIPFIWIWFQTKGEKIIEKFWFPPFGWQFSWRWVSFFLFTCSFRPISLMGEMASFIQMIQVNISRWLEKIRFFLSLFYLHLKMVEYDIWIKEMLNTMIACNNSYKRSSGIVWLLRFHHSTSHHITRLEYTMYTTLREEWFPLFQVSNIPIPESFHQRFSQQTKLLYNW